MARPYLTSPGNWMSCTLEPDTSMEVILRADSGGTPSTSIEDYWDGEIPWLTPKEITGLGDTLFVSRTERTITRAGLANSAAKLLPPETVMLSKRAPVGAVAVNTVPMTTNQGFLNFKCGKRLRPLYLAFWLRANKPYLDKVANGSTYPELYQSELFEFEIAVPPLEEQDRIIRILSALQFATLLGLPLEQSATSPDALAMIQGKNRRLRQIRDKILLLLLSGMFDLTKAGPPDTLRAA